MLRTLIVDNYDSFTYNLAHMVADPLVIRNDEMTWAEISGLGVDRIILSPGPGRPDRVEDFGVCADVIRYADVPVLGVCLGHQGIASVFGGRVVRGEAVHGYPCRVRHNGDELFDGIPQGFSAIRYHSLKVEEPLPEELEAIAWSEGGTVMALRHRTRPMWGVQFHPESVLSEFGRELLGNFGAAGVSARRSLFHFDRRKRLSHPIAVTYEGQVLQPAASGREYYPEFSAPRDVRWLIPKDNYIAKIRQCIEWIRAGESYEICLTNKLLLESDIHPEHYFERLQRINPAPYSAYLDLGDSQVCCSSPECFLRIDAEGNVQARPIKGTLPADRDRRELRDNPRFRAENLMIVDLLRNDLSKVCVPGSVHVPRMMEVETYATVHQLVSTIEGKLRPGVTAINCMWAAFPGGSMTGAPKKRTMELLRRLEPEPRGIYAGTIGQIMDDGSAVFNIVIRTALFEGERVSIGTGGAIVADSDPEEEWAEMELKAQALLRAFMPDEPLH